jgi:cytochrome c oxidase subunit 3
MTSMPRMLDVSKLPDSAWDTRAALWWGNTLLMCIETTTIALVVASYFYLMRNYPHWPPPRFEAPVDTRPLPWLGTSTTNLVIIVLSVLPVIYTDIASRRLNQFGVIIGLSILLFVCVVTGMLRVHEFGDLRVKWNENAYGSTVWMGLLLHLTYLIGGGLEAFIMLLWMLTHEIDERRALDVTLVAIYWYWVAAVEVILYVMIYWVPRMTG